VGRELKYRGEEQQGKEVEEEEQESWARLISRSSLLPTHFFFFLCCVFRVFLFIRTVKECSIVCVIDMGMHAQQKEIHKRSTKDTLFRQAYCCYSLFFPFDSL